MAKKLPSIAERKRRVTEGVRKTGVSRYGPGTLKHVSTVRVGPDADEGGSPGNKTSRPDGVRTRELFPRS